jgi:hypothetical protein
VNLDTTADARLLKVWLYENEISNNTIDRSVSGVMIQNRNNNNGTIDVLMEKNKIFENGNGLYVFNSAKNGNISVVSKDDKIYYNGLGAAIIGGLKSSIGTAAGYIVENNNTTFKAEGLLIFHNIGFEPNQNFKEAKSGLFTAGGALFDLDMYNWVTNNRADVVLKRSMIYQNSGNVDLITKNEYAYFEGQPVSSPFNQNNVLAIDITDSYNVIGTQQT